MLKLLPLSLSTVIFCSSALAVPSYTCFEAIEGTCKHYAIGDAQDLYEVQVPHQEDGNFDVCTVSNSDGSGVDCLFDAMNCPVPPTPGLDGHDEPGVVTCTGCEGTTPGLDGHDEPGVVTCTGCEGGTSFSIREAKCCVAFGQPTNPATGGVHDC